MKVQAVVCVMAVLAGTMMAAKMRCPPCDPEACPKLNGGLCMAGTTKDDCGCCDVCAKLEGQPCDDSKGQHDSCGDGLECKEMKGTGPICVCKFQEILCGSDNMTYINLCHLLATAVREGRTNTLHVKRVGPCEPGAKIKTKPEYVRNHTRSNVVLQCEAHGNPAPTMTWMFTRADGKTYNVPGDDFKMVFSTRGGPGRYMATSWLQIEGLLKKHEGDYTCVAYNTHNKDKSTARIKVVED